MRKQSKPKCKCKSKCNWKCENKANQNANVNQNVLKNANFSHLLPFHPSCCDIWRNPHSFFVNYKRIAFFFTLLLHFHPSFCDIWRNPYTSFVNSREAHFGHIFFAFYLELSTHYQRNPMNFRRVTFLSLFGSHLPVQVQFSAVSKWLYFGFVFTIELIPGIWACSSYRPT